MCRAKQNGKTFQNQQFHIYLFMLVPGNDTKRFVKKKKKKKKNEHYLLVCLLSSYRRHTNKGGK